MHAMTIGHLFWVLADGNFKEIPLLKPSITIGRSKRCDFSVDAASVSTRHAILHVEKNKIFIEDLGSTNGTRVNGRLVGRVALHHQDTISLGRERLLFVNDASVTSNQSLPTHNVPAAQSYGLGFNATPTRSNASAHVTETTDNVMAVQKKTKNVPLMPNAWVMVIGGKADGERFLLNKAVTTLGQSGGHQFQISFITDAFWVCRMDGSAAPLINGVKMSEDRERLLHGDTLSFGAAQVLFEMETSA